jgi:hypothetical protein
LNVVDDFNRKRPVLAALIVVCIHG